MDQAITCYFKVIVDDFNRLGDVWLLYYRMKQDSDSFSLRGFAEALAQVVEVESHMDYKYDRYEYDKTHKWTDEEDKEKWASGELIDFIHTVVIQFTVDELTQFPFWYSKVALCFGPDSLALQKEFTGMFALYKYAWSKARTGGLLSLYSGCIPYITSVFIYQFSEFRIKLSTAIKALIIKLPRSSSTPFLSSNKGGGSGGGGGGGGGDHNSSNLNHDKKFLVKRSLKSVSSLTNISELNENYNTEHTVSGAYNALNSADVNRGSEKRKTPEISWSEKITQKCLITIAGHPCMALAVHMVANSQSNWMTAAWTLIRDSGVVSIFRGLRSNLGFALSAVNPFYLFGIREYFLYNSILSPISKGGILSFVRSMVTSSLQEVRSGNLTLPQIGLNIFHYGLLTVSSLVPSFFAFVAARGIMGLCFSHTKLRRAQIQTRKEILRTYFYNIKTQEANVVTPNDTLEDNIVSQNDGNNDTNF